MQYITYVLHFKIDIWTNLWIRYGIKSKHSPHVVCPIIIDGNFSLHFHGFPTHLIGFVPVTDLSFRLNAVCLLRRKSINCRRLKQKRTLNWLYNFYLTWIQLLSFLSTEINMIINIINYVLIAFEIEFIRPEVTWTRKNRQYWWNRKISMRKRRTKKRGLNLCTLLWIVDLFLKVAAIQNLRLAMLLIDAGAEEWNGKHQLKWTVKN